MWRAGTLGCRVVPRRLTPGRKDTTRARWTRLSGSCPYLKPQGSPAHRPSDKNQTLTLFNYRIEESFSET